MTGPITLPIECQHHDGEVDEEDRAPPEVVEKESGRHRAGGYADAGG